MSSIKPCRSVEQAGWLQLRMAQWPADRDEHLQEMQELCAQPGPYAQLVAYSSLGESLELVEVALRTDDVDGTESSAVGFLEGLYVATASHAMHRALEFAETERVVDFRKLLS